MLQLQVIQRSSLDAMGVRRPPVALRRLLILAAASIAAIASPASSTDTDDSVGLISVLSAYQKMAGDYLSQMEASPRARSSRTAEVEPKSTEPKQPRIMYNGRNVDWNDLSPGRDDYNLGKCTARMGCGGESIEQLESFNLELCRSRCSEKEACEYFTWYSLGQLGGHCFLFSYCERVILDCKNCHTGTGRACRAGAGAAAAIRASADAASAKDNGGVRLGLRNQGGGGTGAFHRSRVFLN